MFCKILKYVFVGINLKNLYKKKLKNNIQLKTYTQ